MGNNMVYSNKARDEDLLSEPVLNKNRRFSKMTNGSKGFHGQMKIFENYNKQESLSESDQNS